MCKVPCRALPFWEAGRFLFVLRTLPALEAGEMTINEVHTTLDKALHVNLDQRRYGTFAEIGAGQEVVRWFFQAGGAAGRKSLAAIGSVEKSSGGVSGRYVKPTSTS